MPTANSLHVNLETADLAAEGMSSYRTFIESLKSRELPARWRELEKTIGADSFITSDWIESWLVCHRPDGLLVRVECNGALVGMGLFGLGLEHRHLFVRSRVAYLHQTGQEQQDQIWVEYNGLLVRRDHEVVALCKAMLDLMHEGYCDEVHLSMLPHYLAERIEGEFAARTAKLRRTLEQPGFYLEGALNQDPIALFSANTRAQIRRSLRRYEQQYGPATLETANTPMEALEFFKQAGHWHRRRWDDSGFNNSAFIEFHERLIKRGFDHGRTRLFRVAFGDHVCGMFYFLVSGRHAFFYLQGVQPEKDGKMKPGLTGHYLIMKHLLSRGVCRYDFMGGDSQYKRQLSNRETAFVSLRAHRNALRFRIEDGLRRLRNGVSNG